MYIYVYMYSGLVRYRFFCLLSMYAATLNFYFMYQYVYAMYTCLIVYIHTCTPPVCVLYIYTLYTCIHTNIRLSSPFSFLQAVPWNRGDTFAITYVFWDIDQRFYKNITTFDNYRYPYDNHYLLDKNGIFKNDHCFSNRVHWTENKIR